MTRQEQIKDFANTVWDGSINTPEGITIDDLIEMAIWADQNPMYPYLSSITIDEDASSLEERLNKFINTNKQKEALDICMGALEFYSIPGHLEVTSGRQAKEALDKVKELLK